MKRALIVIGLAAATAACQRAEASSDSPAAAAQAPAPAPPQLMARGPETRERIQPGRIRCAKPVASVPC